MNRQFEQVKIAYPRVLEDAVENLIAESGSIGTQILDLQAIQSYEADRPEWELSIHEELVSAMQQNAGQELGEEDVVQLVYFEATVAGQEHAVGFRKACMEQWDGMVHVLDVRHIDNSHWDQEWKKTYHPLPIGETIEIVPAWMLPEDAGRMPIYIDPGMAFGTGTHPTTSLCLETLERLDQSDSSAPHALSGRRGLDLGTGSGILAIYMAKCGMAHVLATDIDEDARRAAAHNAALNGVSFSVENCDLLQGVEGRFNVICANLLADLVIRMLPDVPEHLEKTGRLILSGILTRRVPDVVEALTACGFAVRQENHIDEWSVIEADRVQE